MKAALLAVIAAAALVIALWFLTPAPKSKAKPAPHPFAALTEAASAQPAKAAEVYRAYVEKNRASKNAKVQDAVALARIRLGYLAANKRDFEGARSQFAQAARGYRGEGKISPGYGSVPEEAAYQAAVCLQAAGKKDAARQAFKTFIQTRPLSGLAYAAYRRLVRLDGPNPAYDALIQSATKKQEAHARFEMTVCGPKALAKLLQLTKNEKRDYRDLARMCHTGPKGTTADDMRHAMRDLGFDTFGVQVDRRDFARLQTPCILLEAEHYFVLETVAPDSATVYDPLFASERKVKLPALDDPQFTAIVLTTHVPDLEP